MADTAPKITPIIDPITSKFSKMSCKPKQRDYKARVLIARCDKMDCWHELVCSKAVTLPSIINEPIEVEDTGSCSFKSGKLWKTYVPSSVYSLSEFSVELDYTPEKYKFVREMIMMSQDAYTVVMVEANDLPRTQMTFKAIMSGGEVNHSGRNDATLSTISVSFQPSDEPEFSYGLEFKICE